MKKINKRSEISDEYKWDLTAIFKTDDDYLKEVSKVEKEIPKLTKFKDTMKKSAKDLYDAIDTVYSVARKIEKIEIYAHLKYSEDISCSKSIELMNKAENLSIKFNKATSFYEPLLLSIDYSDIEIMYQEYDKLKEYKTYLEKSFRYKKYMLSEQEEKLITDLTKAYSNNNTLFEMLTDSDIDFGTIKDINNNEVTLTNTNYSIYVKSKDKRVRRDAFIGLYSTYGRYKTTLAKLLEGEINQTATFNKLRGYKSSLDAAMYHDELSSKVFDSLIESVSNGFEPLFKYYRIKKEMLGLDELHVYDIYADSLPKYEKTYSYLDAKKLILETLNVFGEDYVNNIKKAFDERWIDVYPNEGKRGGAFSSGGYDTYQYILTNFQGGYNDVSTIIHELGHSMHSYYSRKNNPYIYSDYSIVVAEVASTVNELLLAKHVINTTKDIKEKLFVLDKLMELFKGTIYRQTMYEEFEKFLFSQAEKDEALTADSISDYFFKLNQKYFGDGVVLDDVLRYEWGRMPHLYYNFYMYKYATGLASASYIVSQILDGKKDAVKNYLEFLKTGSTMAPNEELKINGVDLTKKTVCDNAIKMFSELVDLFEKTYNEYKKSSGEVDE